MLYYTMLDYAILYCFMLILYFTMLCYTIPCKVLLDETGPY